MGALTDKAKGKVKEIGGVISGDRELEAEGKKDTAKGNIKEGFEEVRHGIKDALNPDRPTRR